MYPLIRVTRCVTKIVSNRFVHLIRHSLAYCYLSNNSQINIDFKSGPLFLVFTNHPIFLLATIGPSLAKWDLINNYRSILEIFHLSVCNCLVPETLRVKQPTKLYGVKFDAAATDSI